MSHRSTLCAAALLLGCLSSARASEPTPSLREVERQDWFLEYLFRSQPSLCYMRVEDGRWHRGRPDDISEYRKPPRESVREIVLPVFPTVYPPNEGDKGYYDTILGSGMKRKDKVLVIGPGSGSDTWVVWLKTGSRFIYTIEINPMAVANTYAAARLGGYEVVQVLGDFREARLPEAFKEFDWVVWNMPKLTEPGEDLDNPRHDGDDGSILKSFLARLPKLLKPGGKAIIWNAKIAAGYIKQPFTALGQEGVADVFTIVNE